MDTVDDKDAWAQLVSLTDLDTSPIIIRKNKFVIGRNNDCDLPHAGNKLVSGNHCYIEKDADEKVWLHDTSTNGTLLNLSIKLCKGECRELHHGDEIHIVHKKNSPFDDIGYIYQDVAALKAEFSSDLEDTQEDTQVMVDPDFTLPDDSVNDVETPSPLKKRKKSPEEDCARSRKLKLDSSCVASLSITTGEKPTKNTLQLVKKCSSDTERPEDSDAEVQLKQTENQDMTEEVLKLEVMPSDLKEPEEDAIAETLVCVICQELLHDCISLQPCMHSFCAGCYSEWMEKSNECPSCRLKVERINKNHIVNNLVEAYLKVKPEKKRPESDLKKLDEKNKITRDMLYPTKKLKRLSDEDGSLSDYPDDSGDEDVPFNDRGGEGNQGAVNFNNIFNQGGTVFGFGTPFFGAATTVRAAQPVCRQCPNYRDNWGNQGLQCLNQGSASSTTVTSTITSNDRAASAPAPSTGAGPSTTGISADPDAKTFPDIPNFTCAVNHNHVLCLCCMQPMPDRRHQFHSAGGQIPPQQCLLCYRSFCHAYWGCHKADCHGCLAKFKDLNFGKKCLTSLIVDNAYESEIFKNYLESKELSVRDVFADCVARMVTGERTCTDGVKLKNQQGINTPVCYGCGLRNFKELVYFYRQNIPNEDLPKEVTSRPNCYWGKNCRTQRNKPEHAKRFNHICEQTRTV